MPLKKRARVSNGLKQQRNTASKRIRRETFKAVGLDQGFPTRLLLLPRFPKLQILLPRIEI